MDDLEESTTRGMRWFFEHDYYPGHRIDTTFDLVTTGDNSTCLQIPLRGYQDFASNARSLSCFVPATEHAKNAVAVVVANKARLLQIFDGIQMIASHESGTVPPRSSDDLRFTGRLAVYCDNYLDADAREALEKQARVLDLALHLLDRSYADSHRDLLTPDAFVCHDSRDKEIVVRPLVRALGKLGVVLWYDESSLSIGDSLRESIERGLAASRRCIMVLSQNFLANKGWTPNEFDAVFGRETSEGKKLILPIWHGVTAEEVGRYSPILRGRFAANTSEGIEVIAGKLAALLKKARPGGV
jgi:hypothetical protein